MSKTLPANVVLEKHRRATPFAWLALLDLELTNGNDYHLVRNREDVTFVSDNYDAASCVAHYKLNDNLATTAVLDAVGTSDGTLVGGDNTDDLNITGIVSDAFQLDGAADYVDCGDPFQSTLRGSYSIAFWMKPDDGQPGATEVMIGVADTTAPTSLIIVQLLSTGVIRFGYTAEGNFGNNADTATAIFADGTASTWTHVVVVADSTIAGVGGKKIYVDGVETTLDGANDGDTTGVTFSQWTSAQNLYVGSYNNNGADAFHFDGGLDNVKIFSKALTQDDIDALYNAKSDYAAAGCVAHYKLDDYAADTAVLDSSGNSNDGTLTGGANTEDNNIVGQVRDAQQFDGAADYVDTGNAFQSTFTGSHSVSLWVKPDDGQPGADEYIFGEQSTNPPNATDDICLLRIRVTGKVMFTYQADGNSGQAETDAVIFSDGAASVWTHIVGVADSTIGGVGGLKIYINDVEQTLGAGEDGDTTGVVFADHTAREPFIGARNLRGTGATGHFDGGIDNVEIFQRALTPADITFLYNSGNGTELMPNAYGAGTELVPVLYTAYGFQIEPFTQDTKGQITSLKIRVTNAGRLLTSDIEALDGGAGSIVRLIIANSGIITEDYSELTLEFEVLSTVESAQWIEFTLGVPSPLRERFPLMKYLALHCDHVYTGGVADSQYVECGYAGALTTCKRTLADCEAHSNEVRFGGKPGLASGGMRIA